MRNLYACDGNPGAEKDSATRHYCHAAVQEASNVPGVGIYTDNGAPHIWQLVPKAGEKWAYEIRTAECDRERYPKSDSHNCKYWIMGSDNWVYTRYDEGDVFYIKPFAKNGWKIYPSGSTVSLEWGAGVKGVKYLGLWADDKKYHYSIEEVSYCTKLNWEMNNGVERDEARLVHAGCAEWTKK